MVVDLGGFNALLVGVANFGKGDRCMSIGWDVFFRAKYDYSGCEVLLRTYTADLTYMVQICWQWLNRFRWASLHRFYQNAGTLICSRAFNDDTQPDSVQRQSALYLAMKRILTVRRYAERLQHP